MYDISQSVLMSTLAVLSINTKCLEFSTQAQIFIDHRDPAIEVAIEIVGYHS